MARRKNKRPPDTPKRTPESRSLADRHVLRRVIPGAIHEIEIKPIRRQPDLRTVEDLRRVPDEIDKRQTFRTRSGAHARQERRPEGRVSKPGLHTPVHDYFQDPRRVLVCIRRDTRKRVLHALRRIGKGRKVSPVRDWTDKSFVRCK